MNTLRIPVAAMIVAALSLSIFTRAEAADSTEPPTASEVLERAREAMTPPVQFRIRVDGVESTVSQKEIGEQGLAVRTETVAPGFEQTVLVFDGDMYKWTTSNKKGYRLTGFLGRMLAQAQSAAKGAAPADGKPSPGATVSFKDPTTIDGEECWVVEEILPSGIIDSMLATLGVAGLIPRGTRSAVGKQSGRLVETTQLWRNDDGPENVTRYSDITPNAELSNDLFLPPDDVMFKTVSSIEEYAKLEKERVLESVKDFRPWEEELPVKHPLKRDPPVFDEATGTFKLSPPPGFTATEYEAALSRLVLEDAQREGNRLPGEPTLEERHRALNRSRLTPSQLADLAYFEKRESVPREAFPQAGLHAGEADAADSKQVSFGLGELALLIVNAVAIATIVWTLVRRWRSAGHGRLFSNQHR
jgi:hypothetical protein